MNVRIKELIDQCTSYSDGGTWTSREEFDKEKFAELIVKECIDVLDKEVYMALREDGEQEHTDVVLLKHFGIDE